MSINNGTASFTISTDASYGDYLIIKTDQEDPDGTGSLSIKWESKDNNYYWTSWTDLSIGNDYRIKT